MSIAIERGEHKAEVEERYLSDFIKDGWSVVGGSSSVAALSGSNDAALVLALSEENTALKKQIEELTKKLALNPNNEGSQSSDDHSLKVMEFLDKDAIESYIKENFGVDVDKRGSLETVKDKALAVINESGRSGS